jgi:hypothetical protein
MFRQWLARNRGLQLEQRVVRLFKRRGSFNVRRSVRVRDGNGNMSEIDVIAGIGPFKTYIECKNYSGHRVPLEDVAKFAAVLSLNGIPLSRGLFITTSTYVPRARTIGVKTVTGDELVELERTAWRVALLRYCVYAALLLVPVALVASEFTDMDEQALAAVRAHVLAQQHRVDAASLLVERLRLSSARAYDKTKKRLDELVGAWWR